MRSAFRPPKATATVMRGDERLILLAGDFHCHVTPPDGVPHVIRQLPETIALARQERLDFVVLTPHVRARFFMNDAARRATLRELGRLEKAAASYEDLIVVAGFEYTDFTYGHAGFAFGDLAHAVKRPRRFVERYVKSGGVVTINHPLLTPIPIPLIRYSTWDLSWRPLSNGKGRYPFDVRAIDRVANSYEAYNLAIAHLRDATLLNDQDASIEANLVAFDRKILRDKRRMTPVGGSDSHGHHLRATTFVLARDRTREAIAEAVRKGRVCIKSPEACSFMARREGGPWAIVGDEITTNPDRPTTIEIRAPRGATIYKNGAEVPSPITVAPGRCTLIRAKIGRGFSAPIYVGCGF